MMIRLKKTEDNVSKSTTDAIDFDKFLFVSKMRVHLYKNVLLKSLSGTQSYYEVRVLDESTKARPTT